jgi:hypothetical protein
MHDPLECPQLDSEDRNEYLAPDECTCTIKGWTGISNEPEYDTTGCPIHETHAVLIVRAIKNNQEFIMSALRKAGLMP